MTIPGKDTLKEILGEIPLTAELYWLMRQRGKPISRFSLKHLQEHLPLIMAEAAPYAKTAPVGKRIFIFASLHYWIEHAALLGIALAGQGHKVTLGYLPFGEWQKPISRFDLRRQNAYARRILSGAEPLIEVAPMLETRPYSRTLPGDLLQAIDLVTQYDVQYTLQREEIDRKSEIYTLRQERNQAAARSLLTWLQSHRPDIVIVPNGTVQELGVAYRVAQHLKIPVVTYEFGDQRERIWLAQNHEVMRQETDGLWRARQDSPLTPEQMERLHALFAARQRGQMWENFARRWQGTPSQGGETARAALGLDQRPVVLLATNVLGDSLTLGRQVFSQTMAEWIARSVQYFAGFPDAQLVVRVHPGEVLTHGQSMVDVVHQVLPRLPEHIHLIGPTDKINTYDLIDVADVGLVYTTTVGLEMAMNGLPVIVAGQTHYRGRGFTIDPDSWVMYFKQLGHVLANPQAARLSRVQLERAWAYAYRFFFEYPQPFPWHLVRVWEDVKNRPMTQVLSSEGRERYGATFGYLTGEPIDWAAIEPNGAAAHE
ncbi:MAG TPA: hypothetical protein VMT46_18420 [Anaerolineaceae bacterium]|nr:hypothetical protein [Anaerolineaceae bacterium]